jgi:hypothetical protein
MIKHKLPNKTKSATVAEPKLFHQLNNPKVYCPWLNCMAHKAQGTVSYQCSIGFQHLRKIWCIPVAGTGSFVCLGARRADVVSPRTKDFSTFLLSSFNFEEHGISTLGQQSLFLI